MALPAGITTCTVTLGKALGSLFDDATLSGTVQVDRRLVWTATGDTIYPVASSVVASQSGGWLSFVAAHVDQSGFVDQSGDSITNFSYTFNGRATFSDGSVVPIVKNFQVFGGQSTIDLDLLPDGPATLPVVTPIPPVDNAAVAGFVSNPGPTKDALSASYAQRWLPNVAVLAGDVRQAPTGETIKRAANGTTRATYDPTEAALWSLVAAAGVDALLSPPVLGRIDIVTAAKAEIVSKVDYLDATMTITKVPGVADFFGKIQIRGRGNSTWGLPKKPYKVKTASKVSLMGMPAYDDWALLANGYDPSLSNTALALDIGALTGLAWTPRYQFAELYLNGAYQGFYQFTESVKVSSNRINVTKASGTTGLALTGAYSLEIDVREPTFSTTLKSVPVLMDDPDATVVAQKTYLQNHLNAFETMLYGSGFADPTTGYAAWIDPISFADWYLVEELFVNVDSDFYSSCKFVKQRDTSTDATGRGKIVMGPLWDFDLSLGASLAPHNTGVTDSSLTPTSYYTRPNAKWVQRLYDDPAFRTLVGQRWALLKAAILAKGGIGAMVDRITARVASAGLADQTRWSYTSDWATTAAAKKAFLTARMAFFDTDITKQLSVPGSPTSPVATAGTGSASVAFTPSTQDTTPAATYYTVTASTGQVGSGSASPINVVGLPGGTPVTFTVTASNFYGTSAPSAASNQVTPTGQAAPFDANTIPGLALWLDASSITGVTDNTALAAWPDRSPAGRNATQSVAGQRPKYRTNQVNGKAAVLFDATDDELDGTGFGAPDGGAVFVVQLRGTGGDIIWSQRANALIWELVAPSEGDPYVTYRPGSVNAQVDGAISGISGWTVKSGVHNVSEPSSKVYINGQQAGTRAAAVAFATSPLYNVGNLYNNGAGTAFGGAIAEIIVYNQPITSAQRVQVEQYLKAKYAIS